MGPASNGSPERRPPVRLWRPALSPHVPVGAATRRPADVRGRTGVGMSFAAQVMDLLLTPDLGSAQP